jgi:N-acetylmuramoyl-L-alanine amidase
VVNGQSKCALSVSGEAHLVCQFTKEFFSRKKDPICLFLFYLSMHDSRPVFLARAVPKELSESGGNMKRKLFIFAALFVVSALRVQATGGLTDPDLRIIATCMVLEAGGEGPEGMRAVLNVIRHRAKNQYSRMVPEILKPGAFSCMSSVGSSDGAGFDALFVRAQNQPEPFTRALELIACMEQGLLTDNTGGATHYHAHYVTPYWVNEMLYLKTIGGHHFYIELSPRVPRFDAKIVCTKQTEIDV